MLFSAAGFAVALFQQLWYFFCASLGLFLLLCCFPLLIVLNRFSLCYTMHMYNMHAMHVREAPHRMTRPTFGTFGRIIASHVWCFPYGVTFVLLWSFILYHWWSPLLWNLMHNSLLFRLVMFRRCSRQQDPRKSKGDDVFETFSTNPWPLFASSSSSLLSTKKGSLVNVLKI